MIRDSPPPPLPSRSCIQTDTDAARVIVFIFLFYSFANVVSFIKQSRKNNATLKKLVWWIEQYDFPTICVRERVVLLG